MSYLGIGTSILFSPPGLPRSLFSLQHHILINAKYIYQKSNIHLTSCPIHDFKKEHGQSLFQKYIYLFPYLTEIKPTNGVLPFFCKCRKVNLWNEISFKVIISKRILQHHYTKWIKNVNNFGAQHYTKWTFTHIWNHRSLRFHWNWNFQKSSNFLEMFGQFQMKQKTFEKKVINRKAFLKISSTTSKNMFRTQTIKQEQMEEIKSNLTTGESPPLSSPEAGPLLKPFLWMKLKWIW